MKTTILPAFETAREYREAKDLLITMKMLGFRKTAKYRRLKVRITATEKKYPSWAF